MTISFFSNFLVPHQLHFCSCMVELLGTDFKFVATDNFKADEVTAGFSDINLQHDFCLAAYLNDENHQKMLNLCDNSDVLIIGSAPEWIFRRRMKTGKITFRYSERAFKPLFNSKNNPLTLAFMFKGNTIYNNKPLYMLCASGYTAKDYRRVGAYSKKAYRWGYFPKGSTKTASELLTIKSKNKRIAITWLGRMIDWKHGELAIETAYYLKKNKIDFCLKMVGDGNKKAEWKSLSDTYGLQDRVTFTGSIKNSAAIAELENTDIFLFTSDANEGWGAVVNEAMSSCCAVVACHSAGSVPYLINDDINGYSFEEGDNQKLFNDTKRLCENSRLREKLGIEAKKDVSDVWSAENASKNLIELSKQLLNNGDKNPIAYGPCSLDDVK